VYNRYGRRDHKYRSRIKILVGDLGLDEFRARVDKEWNAMVAAGAAPKVGDGEVTQARAFFVAPVGDGDGDGGGDRDSGGDGDARAAIDQPIPVADPKFLRWREHNTVAHRDPAYRIVYVSLKAPGRAPGDMNAAQMDALADLARRYSADEARVTHEQNLVLPWVRRADLFALWYALDGVELATPNIGTLNDMICCPGLDYCSLANAGTIGVARQINARLADLDRLYAIGEVKLKMSGCMNACGHHHAGHIGILGVDKKGAEWYQITLGGSADNATRLGARLGPAVARENVAAVIETILDVYLDLRRDGEKFLDAVIRLGVEPFKDKVYAHHQKPRHRQRPLAA